MENRINKFAAEKRDSYMNMHEYLKRNYQSFIEEFKIPFDLKKERKNEKDEKYKKSQEKIEEFHSKISKFRNEELSHKNKIVYLFLYVIDILTRVYINNMSFDEKIEFYKVFVEKKLTKGDFERRFEQFLILLEMLVKLEDEEIISILENNQDNLFQDIEKRDTIKLLKEKFPNQTKKCPKIGFFTSNENFTVD